MLGLITKFFLFPFKALLFIVKVLLFIPRLILWAVIAFFGFLKDTLMLHGGTIVTVAFLIGIVIYFVRELSGDAGGVV